MSPPRYYYGNPQAQPLEHRGTTLWLQSQFDTTLKTKGQPLEPPEGITLVVVTVLARSLVTSRPDALAYTVRLPLCLTHW